MMNPPISVELIDSTGNQDPSLNNKAVTKLIYTKNTRLEQGHDTWKDIDEMSAEEKEQELAYMANTIPSSWEFVSYTFQIKNVTRAFTHQFVRTRTGSYAQQTMRLLEKKNFTYRIPPKIMEQGGQALTDYKDCMANIQCIYDDLIEAGVAAEDARGVLPTNIHTNIVAQFNLRTIAEMARSRTGTRTQDEYREVMDMMIDEVLRVHPWAEMFLIPPKMKNIKGLEAFILNLSAEGKISDEEKYAQLKHLDKLRKGEQ